MEKHAANIDRKLKKCRICGAKITPEGKCPNCGVAGIYEEEEEKNEKQNSKRKHK